jgi:hypothetical protein
MLMSPNAMTSELGTNSRIWNIVPHLIKTRKGFYTSWKNLFGIFGLSLKGTSDIFVPRPGVCVNRRRIG